MLKKLTQFLDKNLSKVAEFSQFTREYFKNGSFGIAIYPYLMHPCFRKSITLLTFIVAILSAYAGVFYLFGEQMTILFSERSITAYVHHSTLELFFPIGTIIEEKESTLSNLPQVMRAIFTYQAYIFVPLYLFGIYRMSNKRYWVLGLFFACCFSLGSSLVANITNGHYTEGGLQNLGLSLTILMGNLTLLISGLDTPSQTVKKFKNASLLLSLIGLGCLAFTMAMPTIFSPIIERLSIYTIMIWEILAGFTMLKNTRLRNEF